ncbi:CRISPR-associated nuclease/helicase Cas3 [Sulfuracidifex tepidarius]|uniref:CRISPR-associated nuclease/helicase Cas3 n=2 Tax=Sulfuracidifex tepidarius TaxID=1294262 RepID=A0A510DSY5_9CREN|nr:CRISPR-associated helicase Cas3' [Sulfuracidifex tepidarius]BBG23268.1 CRISPR-associated nuclease/helicase Cas3 [Sulfuracidifex tepidarius]
MEFKSHPDKMLLTHLREVGDNAESLAPPNLKVAAYIAGSHHDLGKYTKFFQSHLNGGKSKCSDHAGISSLYAFNTARRQGLGDLLSFFVMDAVKSHHGKLRGVDSMRRWLSTLKDSLEEGDEACLPLQQEEVERNAGETSALKYSPTLHMDLGDTVKEAWKVTHRLLDSRHPWGEYFLGALLFSCLIDADKHSASGNEFSSFSPMSVEEVFKFHDSLTSDNPMKERREILYNAVKSWERKGRIAGIISPTGTGKTISGILTAVKEERRVVYSLPFISIVEQNFDVANAIFPDKVLKFHHMSFPDSSEDEYMSAEDKLLMAESWDYPMVVTTFEGLLATLLSNRNVNLKRLHSLYGSVVILDEVQAIPADKWALVREVLEEASNSLDVHFILMTATMPALLRPDEVLDPLKGMEPNRVEVEFEDREVTPEEIGREVLDHADKSVMVELNTIASAERVADYLKGKVEVEFLSTHVTPWDRKRRIEEMKERLNRGDPFVLVTTQVVEAGVDVDFPVVFRDLGPLDSVIQAAGRCNRNSRLEKGKVFVRRVRREGKATDFNLVYGKFTEEVTLRVMKGNFCEKDFREMLDTYYRELERVRNLKDQSLEVEEKARLLSYDEIKFSLIKEEPKYTVMVLESDEAVRRLDNLRKALNIKGYERRVEVKKWRALSEEFMVKVWEKPNLEEDKRLEVFISGKEMYDEVKGFSVKEREETLLW